MARWRAGGRGKMALAVFQHPNGRREGLFAHGQVYHTMAPMRRINGDGSFCMSESKYRYWCFLVYPESAPGDWRAVLQKSMGMFAISPLHAGDDENAKPHHHVIYCHEGPITANAARSAIPGGIAANGHIEPCLHPRRYQRYLVHLDDADKEQFGDDPRSKIEVLNGFPLDLKRELTDEERRALPFRVLEFIADHDITEYSDLLDALILYGDEDMFGHAYGHTIAIGRYLDSRRHKKG